jgi:predicted RNase H-like HicB family nuclease
MEKKFTIIIEKDENNWFIGKVPELPGCYSQGKTIQQLIKRMKEAIQAYTEAFSAKEIPKIEFIGIQQLAVKA